MKFINSYKLFESESNKFTTFQDYINLDLIEDLKDLSLPYIDEGYNLSYYISIYDIENKYYSHIYTGYYTHKLDIVRIVSEKTRMIKSSIDIKPKYEIKLDKGNRILSRDEKDKRHNINKEIINRLRKMYPNENIL